MKAYSYKCLFFLIIYSCFSSVVNQPYRHTQLKPHTVIYAFDESHMPWCYAVNIDHRTLCFVQHEIAILQHKMWGEGNANFNTCNYNKFLYFNIDTKEHACFAMKSIISASVILLPGFLTTKAMGICPASSSGYLLENKPNCWEFHIAEQPWLINLIPIEALSRQAHYKHYEKL